jgi:hypothetical protein
MPPVLPATNKKESVMDMKEHEQEEEVGPAEDLVREHGALNSMLLIYENARDTLSQEKPFS